MYPDFFLTWLGYSLMSLNRFGLNKRRQMMSYGWVYSEKEGFKCSMSIRARLTRMAGRKEIMNGVEIEWKGDCARERWRYWSVKEKKYIELLGDYGEFESTGMSDDCVEFDETLKGLRKSRFLRVWRNDLELSECRRFCIMLPFTGDESFHIRKARAQELVSAGDVCCLIPELPYYGNRRPDEGQVDFFIRSISDYSTKALVTYGDVVGLVGYVKAELEKYAAEADKKNSKKKNKNKKEHSTDLSNKSIVISGCSIGGYYCAPSAVLSQLLTKNNGVKIGIAACAGWMSFDDWFSSREKVPMAVILTNLDHLTKCELPSDEGVMTRQIRDKYRISRNKNVYKEHRGQSSRELLSLIMDHMASLESILEFAQKVAKKEKKKLEIDKCLDAVTLSFATRDRFIPYSEERRNHEELIARKLAKAEPSLIVLNQDHMTAISKRGPMTSMILDTFNQMES